MKDAEIPEKVNSAMYQQCKDHGYATPVDVLMDIGVLSKKDYMNWRNGKVDYLERVCHCNLSKLLKIMKAMRSVAQKKGYKPSFTFYKQYGSNKKKLRFSKSNDPGIERHYATHFVDSNYRKVTKREEKGEE